MNRKEYCVECNKTLRNYNKGDKKIHRKCWMLLRDKSERHYDFLFCKDKDREKQKKTILIPPLDIAGNEVSISASEPSQSPVLSPPPQIQS
jgi:hypothetical protein